MNTNKPMEAEAGGEPLRVGNRYEFTHGPASSPERTMRGVLEEIDIESNTYTFRLDDGTAISLVDHELDGARLVAGGC
ncbi:MAG TPA: hypothetical protein VF148_05165 [Acidimicrobiia bacterium]